MPSAFTKRADVVLRRFAVASVLIAGLTVAGVYYYAMPSYTRVDYAPVQPVAFSHEQHVGRLGIDCRYCHVGVEESPVAVVPSTRTCQNCHSLVQVQSPLLAEVRDSEKSGLPIAWEAVHKVPDYVYFNHSVHVRRGVGCVSCHGQVNEMPIVRHAEPLSMSWCLKCHREPEEHLRPIDQVVNMNWTPPRGRSRREVGAELKRRLRVNPPQDCSGCHR